MSKRSRVIVPISILVILICLGGVGGMYYLAFTTSYKSEAYMFMGFNILFWFVFGMMVMIMSSASKEAVKRDYVRKHGHLEKVEIISRRSEERYIGSNSTKIIEFYSTVRFENGLTVEINEQLSKAYDDCAYVRVDGDVVVFDTYYTKRMAEGRLSEAEIKKATSEYTPLPKNYGKTKYLTKKIVILWIIIIFANIIDFVVPSIIFSEGNNNSSTLKGTLAWSSEVKSATESVLGEELPEYYFDCDASYIVSYTKDTVYDSSGNQYNQYSNTDEVSFKFIGTAKPSSTELSLYASYLKKEYGYTIATDTEYMKKYDNYKNAINESLNYSAFQYIYLNKGDNYIIITNASSDGYYNYYSYAAYVPKGVEITCLHLY